MATPQLPNTSGLTALPGNYEGATMNARNAVFNRGMNMLRPGHQRARSSLESQLANRGIGIGSEAWKDATSQLDQSQNLARENLALSAVRAGGAEHSRLSDLALRTRGQQFGERMGLFDAGLRNRRFGFERELGRHGMNLADRRFGFERELGRHGMNLADRRFNLTRGESQFRRSLQRRQQMLGERQAERSTAWNELMGVLRGTPVNQPNFPNPAQYSAQAPNYMAGVHARQQSAAGPWGFLGALGSAAIPRIF